MNWWFPVKVCGVGGIVVVVPMASAVFGGLVSRYVRICEDPERGSGKTFCIVVSS
jgi:hypothetical protein